MNRRLVILMNTKRSIPVLLMLNIIIIASSFFFIGILFDHGAYAADEKLLVASAIPEYPNEFNACPGKSFNVYLGYDETATGIKHTFSLVGGGTVDSKRIGHSVYTDADKQRYMRDVYSLTFSDEGTYYVLATANSSFVNSYKIKVEVHHDYYSDFTIDKDSTCIETGSKSIHCKNCNEKKDITEIPLKEHELEKFDRVEPSIGEDGNIEYWQCKSCKKFFSDRLAKNEITDVSIPNRVLYSGVCWNNVKWEIDVDGRLILYGSGYVKDFSYSSFADDCPWYNYREQIKSIEIRDGVKNAARYAFLGCKNIEYVYLADSVQLIGAMSFEGCKPENLYVDNLDSYLNIEFENSTAAINAKNLFDGNKKITELVIPGSVTIQDGQFKGNTSIEKVTIQDGVKSIGEYAFFNCTNLKEIILPSSIQSIKQYAFADCDSLGVVSIPEGVVSIEYKAFSSSGITSITIPESITKLEGDAFSDCNNLLEIMILCPPPSEITSAFLKYEGTIFYYCTQGGWYRNEDNRNAWCNSANWIPMHDMNDSTVIDVFDKTCTTPGAIELNCPECGDNYFMKLADPSHNWNTEYTVDVEATCEHPGCKSVHCVDCGEIQENSAVVIPQKDHEWNVDYTLDKQPDCIHKGSKSIHCKNCSAKKDVTEIETNGQHSPTVVNAYGAGCTTNGYSGDTVCSTCGEILSRGYVIGAHGHAIVKVGKVNPTCCSEGYKAHYACPYCGLCYKDKKGKKTCALSKYRIKKKKHSYTKKIVAPQYLKSVATTKKPAYYRKACKWCGAAGKSTFKYGKKLSKVING